MKFFDCNVHYGRDIGTSIMCPVEGIEEVKKEMCRAGVSKAVVKRLEQFGAGTVTGNNILLEDIQGSEDLYGVWVILPTHTHEMADPEEMLLLMKRERIIGWALDPRNGRYLIRSFVIRDWLEMAVKKRIPIFINPDYGVSIEDLANLMHEFPKLTVIFTYNNVWPSDRLLRPFVAEYENFYIDLSFCLTDGGIESFVKEYGATRLLYGSNFPYSYFGGNMLMIKHSRIAEEDKALIAGENMERIIGGIDV